MSTCWGAKRRITRVMPNAHDRRGGCACGSSCAAAWRRRRHGAAGHAGAWKHARLRASMTPAHAAAAPPHPAYLSFGGVESCVRLRAGKQGRGERQQGRVTRAHLPPGGMAACRANTSSPPRWHRNASHECKRNGTPSRPAPRCPRPPTLLLAASNAARAVSIELRADCSVSFAFRRSARAASRPCCTLLDAVVSAPDTLATTRSRRASTSSLKAAAGHRGPRRGGVPRHARQRARPLGRCAGTCYAPACQPTAHARVARPRAAHNTNPAVMHPTTGPAHPVKTQRCRSSPRRQTRRCPA